MGLFVLLFKFTLFPVVGYVPLWELTRYFGIVRFVGLGKNTLFSFFLLFPLARSISAVMTFQKPPISPAPCKPSFFLPVSLYKAFSAYAAYGTTRNHLKAA